LLDAFLGCRLLLLNWHRRLRWLGWFAGVFGFRLFWLRGWLRLSKNKRVGRFLLWLGLCRLMRLRCGEDDTGERSLLLLFGRLGRFLLFCRLFSICRGLVVLRRPGVSWLSFMNKGKFLLWGLLLWLHLSLRRFFLRLLPKETNKWLASRLVFLFSRSRQLIDSESLKRVVLRLSRLLREDCRASTERSWATCRRRLVVGWSCRCCFWPKAKPYLL